MVWLMSRRGSDLYRFSAPAQVQLADQVKLAWNHLLLSAREEGLPALRDAEHTARGVHAPNAAWVLRAERRGSVPHAPSLRPAATAGGIGAPGTDRGCTGSGRSAPNPHRRARQPEPGCPGGRTGRGLRTAPNRPLRALRSPATAGSAAIRPRPGHCGRRPARTPRSRAGGAPGRPATARRRATASVRRHGSHACQVAPAGGAGGSSGPDRRRAPGTQPPRARVWSAWSSSCADRTRTGSATRVHCREPGVGCMPRSRRRVPPVLVYIGFGPERISRISNRCASAVAAHARRRPVSRHCARCGCRRFTVPPRRPQPQAIRGRCSVLGGVGVPRRPGCRSGAPGLGGRDQRRHRCRSRQRPSAPSTGPPPPPGRKNR